MRPYRLILPALCALAVCSQPTSHASAQGLPAPSLAQPGRAVPGDAASMKLSFAPVVRKAAPAVVNVYSRGVVRTTIDPFWQMFGGMGVPQDRVTSSLGSGVIVRADGVIVTNNHVVANAQEIMVVLGDRREFPAKVLLADPRADVAVLKIEAGRDPLPVLALDDRDDAQVGDLVLAIGDPFGVGQTVTNGIVSALARSDVGITGVSYFIQTDAAVNPGNSGGALIDMERRRYDRDEHRHLFPVGHLDRGQFRHPRALDQTCRGDGAERRDGVAGAAVAGDQDPGGDAPTSPVRSNLPRPQGELITDLYPGGPGERAGLKQGDLILSVDGQPINDESTLNYRVLTHGAGDVVALELRRGDGRSRDACGCTLSRRRAGRPWAI